MKKLITLKYLGILGTFLCLALCAFYLSNTVGAQEKHDTAQADRSYDVSLSDQAFYPKEELPIEKSIFQELRDWWNNATEQERVESEEGDADLPPRLRGKISQSEFLKLRGEYLGRLRGIEPGMPFDVTARSRAVNLLQKQEDRLQEAARKDGQNGKLSPALVNWTEIGPFSLPNGQTQTGTPASVDGRVTAIAVDPTNSNNIYLGTAQGGVWRSTNGGTNWTAIFDNAQTLAVGALAVAPSNPNVLYIGTGEPNLCGDCFLGIGLYRIDNATTTTGAVGDLIGPINPSFTFSNGTSNFTTTTFGGRSISQIVVDPTNAATIWVGSSTGVGGSGGNATSGFVPPLGLVGVYRSTNATAALASITFQKLAVGTAGGSLDVPATGGRRISDLALEPGNPDNLLVSTFGNAVANDGGIFRSTNARAATPTFTQTLTASAQRIRFAINKVGAVVTVLAATSESAIPTGTPTACATTAQAGVLRRSVDGGATFPAAAATAGTGGILGNAGGYCGGQCFYNVTVAMNPTNANDIYLGGNARGTCSDAMKHSTDGLTFTRDDTSVHADSHALMFSNDGNFIFYGSDGGVWKKTAQTAGVPTPAGTAWTDLNASPLNMFQFVSVAAHPTDTNFTIGGTQDNGTEAQQTTSGNWSGAEGGDGGYAVIDQSSPDAVNTTAYHTFFNQANNIIGFDRMTNSICLTMKDSWVTRGAFGGSNDPTPGCDGTANYIQNGIVISDNVLFYAPMTTGPGTPNTLYFGTTKLYRSTDRGDTMPAVSQVLSGTATAGSPISTIGIAPQDDNYRMVGLQNGQVWGTSTGSSTLVNITSASFPANPTGSTTNKFVGRARISPINKDVAYVTFSFYAPAGQGIWKITNFGAATNAAPVAPVWTAAGSGIPSVPINSFVIDPVNDNILYAGTDIGVYYSTDAGLTWNPYGTGLPRVAVFDMAIQPTSRTLRVATHGRGMWEIALVPSLEADVQSRPNGDGFVDSSDIQQIRNFSVGLGLPYQANEFQRADCSPRSTSGDGFVDDGDVQQARRYSVGTDAAQNAAGPTAPLPIPPPVESLNGLKGLDEIRTKNGVAAAPAAFRVDAQNTSAGATLTVPIRVDTVGNEAGYTFSIAFDAAKLTNPLVAIGNGGGDVIFNANNAGQIGFSVTSFSGGTIAAGNNIALVNVTFTVAAGATAGTTPITFTDTPARRKASGTDPNNPITQPTYAAGTITIGGATAAGATISGRVSNGKGRGVANARVIITDSTGQVVQTARTNAFGYYSVADITAGETYIVSVESKQYKFGTRIITVAQDVDGIDFTPQP